MSPKIKSETDVGVDVSYSACSFSSTVICNVIVRTGYNLCK